MKIRQAYQSVYAVMARHAWLQRRHKLSEYRQHYSSNREMALHTSTRNVLLNAARERNIKFVKCVLRNQLWIDVTDSNPDQRPNSDPWDNSEAGRLLELEDEELLDTLDSKGARSKLTQNVDGRKIISLADVLHYAVQTNELDAVAYLLHHAPVNIAKKIDGKPALSQCRSVDMARLLLQHGADVEGEDRDGNTPLACCSDVDIAELLLRHSADANAVNRKDETVLSRAAWRGRSDLVALLIDHRAVAWPYDTKADQFIITLFTKHLEYLKEKESTLRKDAVWEAKMLVLSFVCARKGYDKNCAIRKMLGKPKSRETLVNILRSPSLVDRKKSSAIGKNIKWNTALGASCARDKTTGQKLELTQVIFKDTVTVYLSQWNEDDPSVQHFTFQVRGTTEQVLNKIQRNLKNVSCLRDPSDQDRDLWFHKMSLADDGRYKLWVRYQ